MSPTKATAAAARASDSELGIVFLEGVQAEAGYECASGIWLVAGQFLAEQGTIACNLRLLPFRAA